jgi:hypothetical protein
VSIVCVLLAACSGSGKSYYEACASDSDCGDGRLCEGVNGERFCTSFCEDDQTCRDAFGDRSYCSSESICLSECEPDVACPGDAVCDFLGGVVEYFCDVRGDGSDYYRRCNDDAACDAGSRCVMLGAAGFCSRTCRTADQCPTWFGPAADCDLSFDPPACVSECSSEDCPGDGTCAADSVCE